MLSNKDKYSLTMFMLIFEQGADIKKKKRFISNKWSKSNNRKCEKHQTNPAMYELPGIYTYPDILVPRTKMREMRGNYSTKDCTKGVISRHKFANCQ